MEEERNRNEGSDRMTTKEGYDLGTFDFLKTGWWVWHIIAIAGVFYLGYVFGGSIF
ncbi:MAG: hypothetical protein GX119_03905 [Syntrophomonadaceae bacterium]|jgi:hypothetical protein|nr:hypothetical protein [Syntrophomonadaceae bacterium]